MALNTSTRTSSAAGSTPRQPGPDVVRAVALIGVVVMNYHGYLIIQGASRGSQWADRLFDPWTGPFSTRFASTFVLVAGVGVTLLTRRAVGDADRVTEMRWRLVRRGAILYVLGLYLDTQWNGTIITYYGAMFAIAAWLFTMRTRWVLTIGAASVAIGAALQIWRFWQNEDGDSTAWLFSPAPGSPQSYVVDTFVNGTHPLFPWLGFFCAGIVLGRRLDSANWRTPVAGIGLMCFAIATLASEQAGTPFEMLVLSTNPSSRSIVYVASALGTSLIAYAVIDVVAERSSDLVDPLRRAGQMTLTLYLLHIVVFKFAVDWVGWVTPSTLATSLTFAAVFWVAAVALGTAWHRRLGRGPAERIYRAIGG